MYSLDVIITLQDLDVKMFHFFPKFSMKRHYWGKRTLNKNLVVNEKRWLPFLLTRKDDDLPTHRALS